MIEQELKRELDRVFFTIKVIGYIFFLKAFLERQELAIIQLPLDIDFYEAFSRRLDSGMV